MGPRINDTGSCKQQSELIMAGKHTLHTVEEKIEIGIRVCEMYQSQQATLESCADANGITGRTFYLWCAQISEISEAYKKAKQIQENNFWEEIIKPLNKRAIQRHLEVECAEEESDVVYQGVKILDSDGKPVKQRSKKWVLPNPSVTIFAAKGLFPDLFGDKSDNKHQVTINDDGWFNKLPAETRLEILRIAKQNGGSPDTKPESE